MKERPLDLDQFETHFAELNQKQVCMSILFFLSLFFNVVHAWTPGNGFKSSAPYETSPAEALCFHQQLRLSENDLKKLSNILSSQVKHGAFQSVDAATEFQAKKSDHKNKPKAPVREPEEDAKKIVPSSL